jgi:twinkle protein
MLVDIDLNKYAEYSEIRNRVNEKSDFESEVLEYFKTRQEGILGDKLPFPSADQKIGFRKKEITVLAGVNGHGKSLILGQIALDIVNKGSKILMASLEMPPVSTLARMSRQATGVNIPSKQQINKFMQWQLDYFYLFNHVGSLEAWQVISLCRYASIELGVSHVIIDSLTKCTRGEADYDGQKDFMNQLCEVAKEMNIHIFLVHHVRKGNDEAETANKFDLKGSGSISDLVDNVMIISRNIKKERETERNLIADNSVPDAALIVSKQRHGDWNGTLGLWFDKKSQQFTESFQQPIINYLESN